MEQLQRSKYVMCLCCIITIIILQIAGSNTTAVRQGGCRHGSFERNQHCYFFEFTEPSSGYESAQAKCDCRGGWLAPVPDSDTAMLLCS